MLLLTILIVYGFYDECKRRLNTKMWRTFVDTFNTLPIAALVAGKIFCVHGGLSPSLHNMDEVRNIQRPTDVPDYGLLNDLLWSDPSDVTVDWEDNERGVSYCFGKKVLDEFLAKFDLDLVCRGHMVSLYWIMTMHCLTRIHACRLLKMATSSLVVDPW